MKNVLVIHSLQTECLAGRLKCVRDTIDGAGIQVENAEQLISLHSCFQVSYSLCFNLSHLRHPMIHHISFLILQCRSCPCEVGRLSPEGLAWPVQRLCRLPVGLLEGQCAQVQWEWGGDDRVVWEQVAELC